MPNAIGSVLDNLYPNVLTTYAQEVSPDDNGELTYDKLFSEPDKQPNGLKLTETLLVSTKPVADRRELNAPGRVLPLVAPVQRTAIINPIESYVSFGEEEMYELNDAARNDEGRMLELMGLDLPSRVQAAAMANLRRVELDAYEARLKGTLTQRNPQNAAETYAASLKFPSGLIQLAGTAWNNSTAWANFMGWIKDTPFEAGGVELRKATLTAIRASAPTGANGIARTRTEIEDYIGQEIGSEFEFITNERTVDLPNDGGTTTTETKVFSAGYLSAIPVSGIVGRLYKAPVIRAGDMQGVPPGIDISDDPVSIDEIDLRDNRVFYVSNNDGKGFKLQVQLNVFAYPSERATWSMNAGV